MRISKSKGLHKISKTPSHSAGWKSRSEGRLSCLGCFVDIADVYFTSNACKHVYSRASITEHIRQSGGRAKQAPCPVAGCNKIVALDSLQDDPQLERRVQQHVRRVREQEERAQGNYQAIGDDDDSDEDDLNVRRPRKREE